MPNPWNIFFREFTAGWNNVYDEMEKEVSQYFREQMALGRAAGDILAELEADDSAFLRRFAGRIGQRIDLGSNVAFQVAANSPMGDKGEDMVWVLDPFAEHCDACLALSKMGPRPFSEIPWPGSQPNAGKTNCTIYCKCQIIPAKDA